MNNKIQKITPNLWFDTQAKQAAELYTSIFENSRIGKITRYGKERKEEIGEVDGISEGTVMTVEFRLEGQEFVALNGGPQFNFTEAISFIVHCGTQGELDYFWEKLSEGGDEKAQNCGWLKDKYGVSWQITPANLTEMVSNPDPEKSERVLKALYEMKKIDINTLERAYEG
ncbi:VOC family protein [Virgibacillus sp. YIM 98842]|uniref:VOC family protein n=1 Tax=Virgibacillus sp. YIM 98842 TaxID=2663533 RepID=UPI0013DA034B|nr:VOC family protein [Virgibacillus sp. YIM 98842]